MPLAKSNEEWVTYLIENVEIDDNGCWICHLIPNAKGYCNLQPGGRNQPKWRAHRFIYTMLVGSIPVDMLILHSCDNRRCINLEHLFPGTAMDNTQDMITKGRKVDDPTVGPRRRELTASLIKVLLDKGLSRHEIARRLAISYSTVGNYITGPYRESISSRDPDSGGLG